MEMKLHNKKVIQIVNQDQNLFHLGWASVRQLAHLISLLILFHTSCSAPCPTPLPGLQHLKHVILRRGRYNKALPAVLPAPLYYQVSSISSI